MFAHPLVFFCCSFNICLFGQIKSHSVFLSSGYFFHIRIPCLSIAALSDWIGCFPDSILQEKTVSNIIMKRRVFLCNKSHIHIHDIWNKYWKINRRKNWQISRTSVWQQQCIDWIKIDYIFIFQIVIKILYCFLMHIRVIIIDVFFIPS